jgi:hypothetical protein
MDPQHWLPGRNVTHDLSVKEFNTHSLEIRARILQFLERAEKRGIKEIAKGQYYTLN